MNGAGRCVDQFGNPVDHCVVGEPGAPGATSGLRTGTSVQFGGYKPDPLRDRASTHNRGGYLRPNYDTHRALFQRWRNGK